MAKIYNGYHFYFKIGADLLTFPITPSELKIKIGSNNKKVTLINEGDVNILKSPSLVEIEFEARFPMRQYPYAREFIPFEFYWEKFKEIKEKKKSFRFIVARATPDGQHTWDTDFLVALENIELKESAGEGDDVLISIKLKQFKEYGVRILNNQGSTTGANPNVGSGSTSTSDTPRNNENKSDSSQLYTVKSGDCLWNIAKKFYGNGAKWKKIYDANKNIIEETAKKRGKQSSSNGHWIYPGCQLTIPAL